MVWHAQGGMWQATLPFDVFCTFTRSLKVILGLLCHIPFASHHQGLAAERGPAGLRHRRSPWPGILAASPEPQLALDRALLLGGRGEGGGGGQGQKSWGLVFVCLFWQTCVCVERKNKCGHQADGAVQCLDCSWPCCPACPRSHCACILFAWRATLSLCPFQVSIPHTSFPLTYKYVIRGADGTLLLEAGENRMMPGRSNSCLDASFLVWLVRGSLEKVRAKAPVLRFPRPHPRLRFTASCLPLHPIPSTCPAQPQRRDPCPSSWYGMIPSSATSGGGGALVLLSPSSPFAPRRQWGAVTLRTCAPSSTSAGTQVPLWVSDQTI